MNETKDYVEERIREIELRKGLVPTTDVAWLIVQVRLWRAVAKDNIDLESECVDLLEALGYDVEADTDDVSLMTGITRILRTMVAEKKYPPT